MKPGDIVLSLGKYRLSAVIAKHNEGYSHASLVVSVDPVPLVVEAVPPCVKCILLSDLVADSEKVTVLEDLSIDAHQRAVIVEAGMRYVGALYGIDRFLGLMLDDLFDTQWFGDTLYLSKSFPVCSGLVAATRDQLGLDFGCKAQGANPGEIARYAREHPAIYNLVTIK